MRNNYTASQGFSLIEIMLALVIGSMLIVFSLDLIFSNQRLKTITEDHSLVINNANRAMQLLTKSIRMAGYNDTADTTRLLPFYAGNCGSHTVCSFDGVANIGDQIALQYIAASGLDCAGNTIAIDELAVDIFYVANDPITNLNNLYCRGYNTTTNSYRGNPVSIAEGIDRLDIIYGSSQASMHTDQYLSASEITDWQTVNSVRVSLLARTTVNNFIFDNELRSYSMSRIGSISYTDRIIRHLFSTTVSLPNAN
jgi:type IV pilus assembly protein PilW